eukprot:gene4338-4651_t
MKLFSINFPVLLILFGVLSVALGSEEAIKNVAPNGKTRKTNLTPIEHVIILMLENRSFDHMIGFLKKQNPEINGCLPNDAACSNPDKVSAETQTFYTVDDTAVYQQASPDHSIHGTTFQIYGKTTDDGPATMQGFIESYAARTDSGESVMKCFSPEHVPVLANLTMEYTLFDGWFVSVPGPTMPNRAYAGSASSHGMGTSNIEMIAKGLPQKTMFRQIEEMGLDYRIYFEQIPPLLMFKDLRHKDARPRYGSLKKFYQDVQAGDLPQLTWLDPIYYNDGLRLASDQHPDHDVSIGDQLIKDIYEAVRNGPKWNSTALIITYDEHGGFFDHVPPLDEGVPSPDDIECVDDGPFNFDRLGVRVPTIVVSPWVKKGAVIHPPSSTGAQYEHSSFAATIVHKLFQSENALLPKPDYLNKRDAWAATFESIFTELSAPRDDCPIATPSVNREVHLAALPKQDGSLLVSDFQRDLIALAAGINDDSSFDFDATKDWTEAQAARYVAKKVNQFFDSEIVAEK